MTWQPIETLPERAYGAPDFHCLLFGTQAGIWVGRAGKHHGKPFASIGHLAGDAVEHWGVTHWMPLPPPPEPPHA